MEDNSKVVIKINYAAGKHLPNNAGARPGEITRWNIKRIAIAASLMVILSGSLIYFLWNNKNSDNGIDTTHDQKIADSETFLIGEQSKGASKVQRTLIIPQQQGVVSGVQELNKQAGIKGQQHSGLLADNVEESSQAVVGGIKGKESKVTDSAEKKYSARDVLKEPETVVAPGKQTFSVTSGLTRVQLAKGISGKEPYGEIISPLIVDNDKATGVFYFTELRGMRGETVYHEWLRNGKVVYSKPIRILGKRWRASTSKLMNRSYTGNWTVRLKSGNGDVLNEIKFVVKKKS